VCVCVCVCVCVWNVGCHIRPDENRTDSATRGVFTPSRLVDC